MSLPMTLSDFERQDVRGPFFSESPYVCSSHFTYNQIWHGNTCGDRQLSRGSAT